jgi:hypothetical protein
MILSACDYSTRGEHWAVLLDGVLVCLYERPYSKHHDLAVRLSLASENMPVMLWGDGQAPPNHRPWWEATPDWYAIEGYYAGNDTHGKLAGVHWDIRRRMGGIPPVILWAPQWKKDLGVGGNATKERVKEHIQNLYPQLPAKLPQDAYDAIGIGRAAWRFISSPSTS